MRTVDRKLCEIDPDHAVIAGEGLSNKTVEDLGHDPLIAPSTKRRVRDPVAGEALGVNP